MDSKAEFEFVDFTRHSRAHGPVDHQKNEVAAPVPRRSSAPYPTTSNSRADCACRQCRRERLVDRMEPLTLGDRLWFIGVGVAWLAVFAYAVAVALT